MIGSTSLIPCNQGNAAAPYCRKLVGGSGIVSVVCSGPGCGNWVCETCVGVAAGTATVGSYDAERVPAADENILNST
ncbi:MAG: hypothetical protein OXG42_05370, partial [Chloroflexi bacterium]|nr:hypothetical protein [Chloroflexota bacterium]